MPITRMGTRYFTIPFLSLIMDIASNCNRINELWLIFNLDYIIIIMVFKSIINILIQCMFINLDNEKEKLLNRKIKSVE